jgi:hypothetical protein
MSPQPQQRSLVFPLLMVIAGLVLIVGSIWWTINAQSAQNAILVGQSATRPGVQNSFVSPVTTQRIPYPNVNRVVVADAKTAFDQKQAVFIDTRGDPFFSEGHIPGSLSIMEKELAQRMGELDKNAWIITYCT